jgi:hypothetical protein
MNAATQTPAPRTYRFSSYDRAVDCAADISDALLGGVRHPEDGERTIRVRVSSERDWETVAHCVAISFGTRC